MIYIRNLKGFTMAGIDKTNLRSMARDIAKELDKKDKGGEDNKIEASVWNEFVANKGGKQIKSHISLDNAIKSISTYLAKNATETGESFGDLADKWFNKEILPLEETEMLEKAASLEETKSVEETNQTEGAESTPKTTSKPIAKKAPASEIPPQKFAFPDGIPEVKPLDIENTKKALYYLYVGPGEDIQNKRAQGQTEGKRLANLIQNNSAQVINNVTKENAAYAFLEIQKQIPTLGKDWNLNAELVLKGLCEKLIQRAKDLKIDILKEANLRTIDFDKANSYEKVSICTEISNVIKAHDECKINEMNMFNSISKPNPKLAYETIKDKVSGKTYEYDGRGRIKCVMDKYEGDILSSQDDMIWLNTGNRDKTLVNFDKDGTLQQDYIDENYVVNGISYRVERDEYGKVYDVVYDEGYCFTTYDGCGSAVNDRYAAYDANGKLEYYSVSENGVHVTRDNNGNLIGYVEEMENTSYYKNANGEIIATDEPLFDEDGSGVDHIYRDADGNEITEGQFIKLVERLLY